MVKGEVTGFPGKALHSFGRVKPPRWEKVAWLENSVPVVCKVLIGEPAFGLDALFVTNRVSFVDKV